MMKVWWFSSGMQIWSDEEKQAGLRHWIIIAIIAPSLEVLVDRYIFRAFDITSKPIIAAITVLGVLPVSLLLTNVVARKAWPDLIAKADANNAATRSSRGSNRHD